MNRQNGFSATQIRLVHHNLPIKPTRAQQRRVQNIRPIGGRNHNHPIVFAKPVHFNQQLIQRLLPLIVPATQTGTPLATDRINFI